MKKNMKNKAESAQKYVNILGIKVIGTSMPRLLADVMNKVSHNDHFYIVTPNPELVLASIKNPELKIALNSADFSVPDGVGLSYASRFLYRKDVGITPGRKLFIKLIELANKMSWKVFLLGGIENEAEKTAEKLKLNYKKVKIEAFAGPMVNDNAEPRTEADRKLEKEAKERINKFSPQILFVAMKNPKQEIWIYKNLENLNVRGAMAVGGTFRYIAGMSKLPPKWMEIAGLEWVWRLVTEPKRFRRIFNAFPIFPLRVFWFKVTGR